MKQQRNKLTICRWGQKCKYNANNKCWFKHTHYIPSMEQRAHVAFITTNQVQSLWCKYQDECKDREACQYKHMETYRVRYGAAQGSQW